MSTITNLQSTDNGADSLSIINTNLGNLNTDKLEASDITGKEDVLNKKTSLADNSDTFYPTQKAVKTAVDAKQDTLAFTPEDSANKETSALDTSTTKYPCNNVVKEAVDAKLPLAGGTMTGDIQLGETDIKLDATLSADEKWSGITVAGTAGATLAVGDVCYLATSGKWLLNDGILDGTDTGFDKQLGVCVLAGADTEPTEMLLYGKIRSASFPVFTVGSPVYLSDTAGDIQVAQPDTTNFAIRKVGIALSAEELMWSPSPDYIVHI